LLPYAMARGANAIELYYADWQVAFDPSSAKLCNVSRSISGCFSGCEDHGFHVKLGKVEPLNDGKQASLTLTGPASNTLGGVPFNAVILQPLCGARLIKH
jgi:hypothetical protein